MENYLTIGDTHGNNNIWIFGHHHKRRDEKINGTRFICLEEFGTFVI